MFDSVKIQILKIISAVKNPKSWKKDIESNSEIMKSISLLKDQYEISTQAAVYCIVNDVTPICKYGVKKKFTWFANGFAWCGNRQDCKCNKEFSVEKSKQTNLNRYGVESFAQSKEYLAKAKATNIRKFGVAHASLSPAIRDRATSTCMEKYGTKYPIQLEEFKKKTKQTKFSNHGDENFNNSDQRKETLNSLYGVSNPAYIKMTSSQIEILMSKESFESFVHGKSKPVAAYELGVDPNTISKYAEIYGCHDMFLPSRNSKLEYLVKTILDNNGIKYIQQSYRIIPPYELDFYLPDFNIAIELNGNYWHSESKGKTSKYHYNKWKKCKVAGFDLYQYFEDEVLESLPVIESKIKYLTKKISKSIGARNLLLKDITFLEEKTFLSKYHIQQYTKSRSAAIGAFLNDDLIGVMSWCKRENTIEIIRYATKFDAVYPGLFSKMLSKLLVDTNFHGKVISFSDNRHSNGNVYKTTGFTKVTEIPPAYFYTRDYITRENRQRYMKSKIKTKFQIDVSSKTERQLMSELGYDRIWDAGKIKWQKIV